MWFFRITFECGQSEKIVVDLLNNDRGFHYFSKNKKQVEFYIQPANEVIWRSGNHPSKALKQIEALCPPKPNVLLMAAFMGFAIGTFGT